MAELTAGNTEATDSSSILAELELSSFQAVVPLTETSPRRDASMCRHDYDQLRFFRRFFSDSVARVLKAYPEARLKLEERGRRSCRPDRTFLETLWALARRYAHRP